MHDLDARPRTSDPDALVQGQGSLVAARPGHAASIFFAGTWLTLAVAGSSRMFQDPGVFWHLLTGERILTKGLPHEDWLTFTHAGKPWIAHQWLAEIAMAMLRRVGGYDALLVVVSGLLALLFTWTFQRLVRRGVSVRWAVLLTSLGVLTGAGSFHVRPLTVSIVFFAFTFARLTDVETGRAGVPGLVWLLPLLALWANCHGAVIGGIATIELTGGYWLVRWLLGRATPVRDRADALTVALVLLGAVLSPLVNPYGLELLRTWSTIMRSSAVADLIVEHASVWRSDAWYVLPLAIVYLAVWTGAGDQRSSATNLVSLGWLALMLERVRHAPFFAIAALLSLAEILPRSAAATWLAARDVRVCDPASSRPAASSPRHLTRALGGAPVVVLVIASLHFQATGRSFSGPSDRTWPFALTPAIEAAARTEGPGAPILNDMSLGGFLSQEVPSARIFGDDRCELYSDAFLYGWVTGGSDWFARQVAVNDVRIAVARRGTALDAYLRAAQEWRPAASEASTTLFLRARAAPGPARAR